jgi:subtilisin-like proprotein convertase family protein/subtilisin family serine protease
MAEPIYFWQGGRRIEVREDETDVTIQAENEVVARHAASRAGVELGATRTAAPGLVHATVAGNRDTSMTRLRTDRNVVHHVYRDVASPANEYLITETFFIKFKDGTPEERMREYFAAEHLVVEQEMDNNTFLVRVTSATGKNPIKTANAALQRGDVEFAEPNLVRTLTKFFIPPDTLFAKQWHLHAPTARPQLVAGAGIFAPEAWDITRGIRDVVVAVADDGFDLTHPDFQGPGKVVAQLNATVSTVAGTARIAWNSNVTPRPGDYHGTPCLGVAVAEGNGTGVVGAAPGCALVAVRFPLDMSDAHFIVMFQKISTLADIVSCSWGVGPGNVPMSTPLRNSIATLARTGGRRGKGLVFCVAAGNSNCPVQDLTNTRTYRFRTRLGIASHSGPIDRWIGAHPDVITVSASTSLKTRSAYSSWGRQISVCAPSDNWDDLGQTTPPGLGVVTTDNEGFGQGSDFTPSSRFTEVFGGTSSATPTVAGVCALVISTDRSIPGPDVKRLIQQTADKDLSQFTDTAVNEPGTFSPDGFSLWFGHGKVNAFRAVSAAALRVAAERMIEAVARPNQLIPDVGSPVVSAIDIADDGILTDLRVRVDISHTFIGDLRVDLIAPDGSAVSLHNNSGGSTDNLTRTYSVAEVPALRPLFGRSVRGRWQLAVRDTARFDIGRFREWRIAARVAAPVVAPVGPATPAEARRDPLTPLVNSRSEAR